MTDTSDGWKFDKSIMQWRYTHDGEILMRVSVEDWDNFLTYYGGSSITVGGFTIPVPVAEYFISKEEIVRDEALRKILSALAARE